jgi:hypothetical protein
MSVMRRVDHWLSPPGHVPFGPPRTQAHLARWWHWYGVAGGLGLAVVLALSVLSNIAGVTVLGGVPSLMLLYALWGWRITHPPQESLPE